MNLITPILCLLLCSASAFGQSKKELRAEIQRLNNEVEQLKTPKQIDLEQTEHKANYALGIVMAKSMQAQGFDEPDLDVIVRAFRDVFLQQDLKLSAQEAQRIVQQYRQEAIEKKSAQLKEEGATFLAENKKNEEVKVTESGLQYKILRAGSGLSPKRGQKVTVHYTGKLLDGSVFDSSIERGEPITFGVNQVIAGWTEALQLMQEGDKWRLFIPYELAYGERGAGAQIPPYATLIFDVELLKVNE